jgi:hypothetical protein
MFTRLIPPYKRPSRGSSYPSRAIWNTILGHEQAPSIFARSHSASIQCFGNNTSSIVTPQHNYDVLIHARESPLRSYSHMDPIMSLCDHQKIMPFDNCDDNVNIPWLSHPKLNVPIARLLHRQNRETTPCHVFNHAAGIRLQDRADRADSRRNSDGE